MATRRSSPSARRGLTLVELLVVIVAVTVLSGLVFAGARTALDKADQARETSALRNVVQAYLTTPLENGGELMPSYDQTASLELPDGALVSGPAAWRYPWRLAPYLDYNYNGTLFAGDLEDAFEQDDHYEISLNASFGINYEFVGGVIQSGGDYKNRAEAVVRMQDVPDPSRLVAFASSFSTMGAGVVTPGYHQISPPKDNTYSTDPDQTGHVHYRHDQQAVVAFLDGSVRRMGPEDLSDMRYWSPGAQKADKPDYTPSSGGPVRER